MTPPEAARGVRRRLVNAIILLTVGLYRNLRLELARSRWYDPYY
jgi:hypothetical protein